MRQRLSPLIYLSNNLISRLGVVAVTTATVFWFSLLPVGEHPYLGILAFLVVPGVFFAGLLLIPTGIVLRKRREKKLGLEPAEFPPLDFQHAELRKLLAFIGVTTFLNVVLAGALTYKAVTYMETVGFCGQACHSVMKPEFTAYQNSPHSRVECVKCHIGPGASWFVRSKLSGTWQLFAVTFNTYPRPIPTPIENLRPARETCEACHWPQKYGADRLRVFTHYGDDEASTPNKTVLLMRIGGGSRGGPGIHAAHLGEGTTIRYGHKDPKRQDIPWIEYRNGQGRHTVYAAADAKPDPAGLHVRLMDCMDCHTRPSHSFQTPERAADSAIESGALSRDLPFVRKKTIEILRAGYATTAEAEAKIPEAFERFYRESYPNVYANKKNEVMRGASAVYGLFSRNVFPEMNLDWNTYIDNIGHTDFPGCFRCHDGAHASSDGRSISQDCSTCHSMLAVEEPQPKVLTDLGVTSGQ